MKKTKFASAKPATNKTATNKPATKLDLKAAPKKSAAPAKAAKTKAAPKSRPTKQKAAPKSPRPAVLGLILQSLDDDKAEDIVEIDMHGKNPMTDFMVVATGRSQRHVAGIAENLIRHLKEAGYPSHAEGLAQGDWVLLDALDVIVHIFRPEIRTHYAIERMWGELQGPAEPA